ncbi:MAG: formate dehydrogenase accessory sulfurtransferase FdhD, partial [Desulfobulbales bacterium]
SGEIMTKVISSHIPVIISRTAPTCMSITHAEDHGVTLIGFARGSRMNIYTHPQRVIFNS